MTFFEYCVIVGLALLVLENSRYGSQIMTWIENRIKGIKHFVKRMFIK